MNQLVITLHVSPHCLALQSASSRERESCGLQAVPSHTLGPSEGDLAGGGRGGVVLRKPSQQRVWS